MERSPARKAFTATNGVFILFHRRLHPSFQPETSQKPEIRTTHLNFFEKKRSFLSPGAKSSSLLPKPRHLLYPIIGSLTQLLSLAFEPAEAAVSADKINLEWIVIAVDDLFNRNPFFVAGCTFVWLVVVPVVEYYVSKYKYASAIEAFRKLRDDPDVELLDNRKGWSMAAVDSPDLKLLKKKGMV